MNRWYPLLLSLVLGACAGPDQPLVVKQFRLSDGKIDTSTDPMVRGEKLRRLHGAVTAKEQQDRLGCYYTLIWSDPKGVGGGEVQVVFEYQQGATASKVLRLVKSFPASAADGTAEFAINGANYWKGGRVLAWKATLTRGGRVLATEKSHLWQ